MVPAPQRFRPHLLSILVLPALLQFGCGDVQVGTAESVLALAGASGGAGFFDGSPSDPVRFDSPSGVGVTSTGVRFVADTENHVIRRIDASGNVTTFAGKFGTPGTANGTGSAARFDHPTGIVADGVVLFVCDTGNHAIRRISAAGEVTTVAGTPGTAGFQDNASGPGGVLFSSPGGILSGGANTLYVADTGNHRIRRLVFSGATETIAGSGTPGFADNTAGLSAQFDSPGGIAFDGGTLYVADTGNHAIRRITPAAVGGAVERLAGDGSPGFIDNTEGLSARFSSPRSLIFVGGLLFVADAGNHVLRAVDTTNFGFTTRLAGSPQVPGSADGIGGAARFREPAGLGIQEGINTIFFAADAGNHALRQVTVAGGVVSTVAGNPPRNGLVNAVGENARFDAPAGIAVIGDDVFVADTGNNTIRKVTPGGVVTSLTGSLLRSPQGIVAVGTDFYVADTGNHAIRKVTSAGAVTTFAGSTAAPPEQGFEDATGTAARFRSPRGIATDGNFLYVADTGNHAIRKIGIGTAAVTTLAGDGTVGLPTAILPRFDNPEGIVHLDGNLYVADTGNHAIRKVSSGGSVSTFAGSDTGAAGHVDDTGTDARFDSPRGITAVDSALYVADTGNHVVRRISTVRKVTTFAGDSDAATTKNGDPSVALLNAPTGIAGVPGTIYFTDTNENVVRRILY